MTKNDHPLSQEEFDFIYSQVPRLTVEIIIKNESGQIFLTQRAIDPCKGQWHLPGGTVHFAEPLTDSVKRIALRELGIKVNKMNNIGYIEYPSHYLHGLDSPLGIVFEVTFYTGKLKINNEASNSGWFKKSPTPLHDDLGTFLQTRGYLED